MNTFLNFWKHLSGCPTHNEWLAMAAGVIVIVIAVIISRTPAGMEVKSSSSEVRLPAFKSQLCPSLVLVHGLWSPRRGTRAPWRHG